MTEYQDKIVQRRKDAAQRSRRRNHRSRGDLINSRTICPHCQGYFFAAMGACNCPQSRTARQRTTSGGAA